ncbi:MAG: class II aldolase/adducin family protein [Sandaracinaceae bacterium]|nr:class II aldolase/adducin family protein [Sandaracinaceae bacterium]
MIYAELREAVCAYAIRMWKAGLVVGSAGNVSARVRGEGHFVITPSSIAYDELTPDQIMVVDAEGDLLELDDEELARAPSFETPVHLGVYAARPDVHAIVHTHSRWASARAVARVPIPPVVDEMVVYLGGPVELADYAASGSDELAAAVVRALGPRSAVLLSAHGVLTTGKDLKKAFKNAELVEHVAEVVTRAEQIRGGVLPHLPAEVVEAEQQMYAIVKGM